MITIDRTAYHFLRAIVMGVRIVEAWNRYYAPSTVKAKGAVSLVKTLRKHCYQQARDRATHGALNLLPWRRLLKQAWFVDFASKDTGRTTFENWIESLDESAQESFSLRELREIYESQSDSSQSPIVMSSKAVLKLSSSQQNVILEAIDQTLFAARQRPRPEDWLEGWIDVRSIKPLQRAGITTVSQLHERICKEGYGWYRRVNGIGPNRSVRLIHWLHHSGQQVPIERRVARHALRGLPASTDVAVNNWLGQCQNPHTSRAFAREVTRFKAWFDSEREKSLEKATLEDLDDYRQFLMRLGDASQPWNFKRTREEWQGSAFEPKASPGKRLFSTAGLSVSSVEYAVRVCKLYLRTVNKVTSAADSHDGFASQQPGKETDA